MSVSFEKNQQKWRRVMSLASFSVKKKEFHENTNTA